MPTFKVFIREVWVQEYEVEASSEKEAITKVSRGLGDMVEGSLEYSHALDTDTWTAEEDKPT